MEIEQWPSECQQSVCTAVERTDLNNGDIPMDSSQSFNNAGNIDQNVENRPDTLSQGNNSITISDNSKQKLHAILEQIKGLSPVEKYIFNLKFPSEISNIVDPFRQPLNPLGSRPEIYCTISWINTHLKEDPETSLPKQEVYDEYHRFCDENKFKPLSQADFGKAMKQVYPNVRARRLGTRGKSRYCYSGLRRCLKLKPPVLPDLADKPMSTEAPFTPSVYQSAWLIIREWAKQQIGKEFSSLFELALYLVYNYSICQGTDFAYKLTLADSQLKEEFNSKSDSKHREMQMQLQRKIQQKHEIKERKRKSQSPKSEQKSGGSGAHFGGGGTKKARAHSVPNVVETSPMLAVTIAVGSECGVAATSSDNGRSQRASTSTAASACSSNTTSPIQGKPVCDKSLDYTQRTSLPEFNSFHKPQTNDPTIAKVGIPHSHNLQAERGPTVGKVAIAKLMPHSTSKKQQQLHFQQTAAAANKNTKYKAIQPKMELCDIASYNSHAQQQQQTQLFCADENRSQQDVSDIDSRFKERKFDEENECEGNDFPLPRERLESISNVDKNAMDEYLDTNNSQHEEELSKYFGNSNVQNDLSDDSKISYLRHMLQNGIVDTKPTIMQKLNPIPEEKFTNTIVKQVSTLSHLQFAATMPNVIGQATRRRVSFDTRGLDNSVPPSPNTRRKNFSFTPISPGPQSPNGIQSKCSSTTVSPFVSPRNTPVPRTKNNAHQNAGIMVGKTVKVKKEISLDLSENFNQSCMPMSAPPSPMLQKLLNSKGPYKPNYIHMQSNASNEVSQFLSNQLPNELNDLGYRSQSVPVNQMMFMPQNDFSEVDPIRESECTQVKQIIEALDTHCDNNNLNLICNLEMSSTNQSLPEYGLHLVNNNLEIPEYPISDNLQNPSRSVPSTPLPFGQNFKHEMPRSYPSTPLATTSDNFTYQINNGDCLLNGQPIRSDDLSQHGPLDFVAATPAAAFSDTNGTDNLTEFSDGSLLDETCVLNYGANIN
ncbi:unnamed protein product [Brassicogethes aeneus]|uniref:RFX-type winged-helix domain-containing protein n=1 Tax=Brassicogethes aeneus TaxID=1431903 RepID=A0A9P0FFG3_BRAAE|nr:unnamed protein product [Brassicogethes aeneus]